MESEVWLFMIEIQVLGPVTIVHEGQVIEVSSCRVRTVLAMLALSWRTPLRFEYLMDELWPERSLGNARNALQASMLRLRRLLEGVTGRPGDELVRTVGGGYLLDVQHDAVDANRFLDLAERGVQHVERDPKLAIDLLERALGLWRGPALSGVSDGLRCRTEAARLDDRRLSAREDLITARLTSGDSRAVLSELSELTIEYPERERLSEQLMLALYRSGRQTEALDVFHHARRRLASELGLEPGRALRQLYQAILVHDQVLG
jgi:SARP family transcriptional regulator, regulator of embCAB operon